MVRKILHLLVYLFFYDNITAQVPLDLRQADTTHGVAVQAKKNAVSVKWPVNKNDRAEIIINLENDKPLFNRIQIITGSRVHELISNADPVFLLTVGKRDLVSQNGWNIFFDKVPLKPHRSFPVQLTKQRVAVCSKGSRTIIQIGALQAGPFTGTLEITIYDSIPLFNIAALMATTVDSTAIVYDAGMVSDKKIWNHIAWASVYDSLQTVRCNTADTAVNQAVKYRTIIGSNAVGSMAVFPAPHQYFYPLDEAFNLKFTWYGSQYNKMFKPYGLGIRQDLYGDSRYVPWFNAPPGTQQRLNFFCYISTAAPAKVLEEIKAFTHGDRYTPLPGFKTMVSHFHNEHIMKVVLAGKPVPDTPNFVKVFENTGVNIVHLAEFHYTAHPKGPDEQRLTELKALFHECRRLSGHNFLLLPGEEPNEFFGGHWLAFFPKPVYWIMSRKDDHAFMTNDPLLGNIYHVSNAAEMLELLQRENGLVWTAHARTKGSTGFPDAYMKENFFLSDHFLGAAWKAMPADLSQPRLGKRVLDLMDDMNNAGFKKKVLSEADLFSIEPENEMYAHLNVNYLRLPQLPSYDSGWQPLLDALQQGRFFSTTGEVLIPSFTVDGKTTGETLRPGKAHASVVSFDLSWTFPLNFAEIISGDGRKVYRHSIDLSATRAFGQQTMRKTIDLSGRKWVRLEVWDVAANGAFTQTIWIE